MPRPYRLGERAAQIQATRDRIVDAAIELYMEVGISAATMREIGVRADVAPGTLRSHFPSRDRLDEAMVERLSADIPLPDSSIFEGAETLQERVGRVILAGGTFSERAQPLYRMWLREPMLTGPWVEKGAEYGTRWDLLMRAALGPLADDEEVLAVLRAVIHPVFFESVGGARRSTEATAALVTSVVSPWLGARARQQNGPDPR